MLSITVPNTSSAEETDTMGRRAQGPKMAETLAVCMIKLLTFEWSIFLKTRINGQCNNGCCFNIVILLDAVIMPKSSDSIF